MTGSAPGHSVDSEVLESITARFAPMPPDGIAPPDLADMIQLRIGTLVAETSWPEISALTGVQNANGDQRAITMAFSAIEAAARERHNLTRRIMIRVHVPPGFGDRLAERLRPGNLRRGRSTWLVWGERGERWTEEP